MPACMSSLCGAAIIWRHQTRGMQWRLSLVPVIVRRIVDTRETQNINLQCKKDSLISSNHSHLHPAHPHSCHHILVFRRRCAGDVFSVPVRVDILHRVVRWQRARMQQGTHKTKNRAEVSGGGRKPHPQKKTGQARQGSRRAPHFVHGGISHGPRPRSHAHSLPKKVRRLGLKCALSAKAFEGRLLVVDSLQPSLAKTKVLSQHLERLLKGHPRRSVMLIDSDKHGADGGEALRRAAGNLRGVDVVPQGGANVYGILRRDVLIITKDAVLELVERLRRPINRLGACGDRLMQWKIQKLGYQPISWQLLPPEHVRPALPPSPDTTSSATQEQQQQATAAG